MVAGWASRRSIGARNVRKGCWHVTRRILAVVVTIVLGVGVPLFAQVNDATVKDGNIEPLPSKRAFVEYALAGFFLLAALALGFYTSKRGND